MKVKEIGLTGKCLHICKYTHIYNMYMCVIHLTTCYATWCRMCCQEAKEKSRIF